MITDITKFLEEHYFYKGSTVQEIIIPYGGNTLLLIVNEKSDNAYKKNLHKLTFQLTEKISQINNSVKTDKISNVIDSIHSKSAQVANAHTVELVFADTRRIEITFHHLDYTPYSDEQDIIISK